MFARVETMRNAFAKTGYLNVLNYIWKTKLLDRIYSLGKNNLIYRSSKLNSKLLLHPVYFRYDSSDICVFHQIFIIDEYGPVKAAKNSRLIIDCGANVGYSSAYFLSKYADSHVVAIEPDEGNYEMLKKNLDPYGERATIICSAVWSHKAGLKVNTQERGSGGEWATTVRECKKDETPDLFALDISSILEMCNRNTIDILKIDIEGSESTVFSLNYEDWLNKTKIIVIELHGKKCRDVFESALSPYPYRFERSGELTIAERA